MIETFTREKSSEADSLLGGSFDCQVHHGSVIRAGGYDSGLLCVVKL